MLLFGEYTMLYGSDALAMPLSIYSGKLSFIKKEDSSKLKSNLLLKDYFQFLKKNESKFDYINFAGFEQDLKDGLYFKSSIPQKYGLGSSGALVASVFSRYHFLGGDVEKHPNRLRILFSNLESWFHGKSSGIGPLVSFLGSPMLIRENMVTKALFPVPALEDDFWLFLVDTGQEASTGFQIRSFQQLLRNKMFYYLFLEKYLPYVNSAIMFFLEKNHINFDSILADIVDFQVKNFRALFPSSTRDLAKEGLKENAYYLKLCGSGGGGYLLGFTQDMKNTKKLLRKKNVNLVEVPDAFQDS